MKRSLLPISFCLLLAACGPGTDGLSAESSRGPKGNPNAAVLVEEFADLQCPACRAAHTTISKPILEKYGNNVRFEFKHFPLRSIHRFALDAAYAAECAADQGKFWEFVEIDFQNQDQMSLEILETWAQEAGIADLDLYKRCVKTKIKKDTILADFEEGRERGVRGTPAFFVNRRRVEENTYAAVSAAVEKAIGANAQPL